MADDDRDEGSERRPFDLEGAVRSIIARNANSPDAALRTLTDENFQLRKRKRELIGEVEKLSKRPELKTGERVLTADEVKRFEAFEALGVKPEDVKTKLAERDQLEIREKARKEEADIAIGVKRLRLNAEVLTDLIRSRNLQKELRDVEVEGDDGEKETVKVLHLRAADNETWQPADKYAKTNLKGYLPALIVKDGEDDADEGDEDDSDQESEREQPPPRPFPRQQPRSKDKAPSANDVVSKHMAARYVTPSQLRTEKQGA